MNRLAIALLFGILASGCATTYHQADDTGGYYQRKVSVPEAGNEDTYRVGFLGNGFSNDNDVHAGALRRAEEMGQQLGYKFFSVEGSVPVGVHEIELTIRYFREKPSGKFLELREIAANK